MTKFLAILILSINYVYAQDAEALAKKSACLGCHSVQYIGISYPPAFSKLAEKYKDNADQIKYSIRYGKGKMPAHPMLTEKEIVELTNYILSSGDQK
jgi:cytochrome c551/c552